MKKTIALILVCTLFLSLVACSGPIETASSQEGAATVSPSQTSEPPDETAKPAPEAVEPSSEYRWDLTDIYPTQADFEKDAALFENEHIPKYEQYAGKLQDKENVLECLNSTTESSYLYNKLYLYASLGYHLDMGDSAKREAMLGITVLAQKYNEATSFLKPELLLLDDAVINEFIADPDFAVHVNTFQALLTEKPHILSESENELLAKLSMFTNTPSSVYSVLDAVDISFDSVKDAKGNEIPVTHGSYGALMENPDRALRKAAYESRNKAYLALNNTMAANLAGEVYKNIFYAEAKKYDSALESALEYGIPVSVYENLIAAAENGLPVLHRYVSLYKEALGLDLLYSYDFSVPLVSEIDTEFSFESAKTMITEAMAPLGDEYSEALNSAFSDNWIDVYETPGKASGAYSTTLSMPHPFVLLNYNGTLRDVSFFAHEMGHAMHSYYTFAAQPFENSSNSIFTTEVASIVNEVLLYEYLIDHAETNREKLYYLTQQADLYAGTFYAQTMNAAFEKDIHETAQNGGALTADALNGKWLSLTEKYYGDSYTTTEFTPLGWSMIPHFYNNFYVYQYATSMAAANQIASGLINGEDGAREKYLEFLSSGSKYDPITTLANAGVDMSSPQVIEKCAQDFGLIVDEIESLMRAEGMIK